jgi:alanine racemase
MDQCMVDATSVPDANLGDEVVLWGEQQGERITIEEIAEQIGTINYEVICMISKRVPRIFFRHGQIVEVRTLLGR